ncbi:G-protein alpha subunit-domain-containing protein [Mycena sanguinolenta]|nr:G-protein alpha subunit-domain-containing protein [Mycena sanguinolenta]
MSFTAVLYEDGAVESSALPQRHCGKLNCRSGTYSGTAALYPCPADKVVCGSFFAEIQRLSQPGYIPTEQDVLCMPGRKNSITETRLTMGLLSIRLIDVGPQRSERKKWIHCFESVTSVIFCTALSDYDQVLIEDRDQNRMCESITLFSSIINSRWFVRTSIFLFFTEIDVFKAKISKIPLSSYFPEYTGGPDVHSAARFILWRFMQENRARLSVYPHLARTTDVQNVQVVFAAVKETILQNAIKDSGIPSRVAGALDLPLEYSAFVNYPVTSNSLSPLCRSRFLAPLPQPLISDIWKMPLG